MSPTCALPSSASPLLLTSADWIKRLNVSPRSWRWGWGRGEVGKRAEVVGRSLKPSEEELLPTPLACRDAEKPGQGAGETAGVEPWLPALGQTEHAVASAVWAGWEGGPQKSSQTNRWLKAQTLLPGLKVSFAIFQLWDLEQVNFWYALIVCVQRDGARRWGLGRRLSRESRTLVNGTSIPTKETPERSLTLPSWEDTARRRQRWVGKSAHQNTTTLVP